MFQAIKKFIIFLGVLLGLGYFGNLLIDNPYVHKILRDSINEKLEIYTKLGIKFEAINVKFVPPGFDIYGVELRQKIPDNSDIVLAQIAHLQVRFSPLALILSQPQLIDLQINEPRTSLPLPSFEQLLKLEKFPNWNEPSKLQAWPLELPMPLYHLAINNAIVNIKIPDPKPELPELITAQLDGLNLDFKFRSWETFSINLQLKRGNLSIQGAEILRDQNIKLSAKQVANEFKSDVFTLDAEELQAKGQIRVNFETEAKPASSPLANKNAKYLKGLLIAVEQDISKVDMAILGRYLDIEQTTGKSHGKTGLQLHIPFDQRSISWRLDAKAQSENATLFGFKLLDSKADFTINDQGMTFEDVKVLKGQRELARGRGFLGFTKTVPFHFDLSTQKLPFNELMSVLKTDDFTAFSSELSSSTIALRGQALPFSLQISGLARFDNVSLPFVKDLPKRFLQAPSCEFDTLININAQLLDIHKGEGHCWASENNNEADSPFSLGGKFFFANSAGVDFTFHSAALNGLLLNHFTKFSSKGTANFQARIYGPYDQIKLSGEAKTGDFLWGGFAANQLSSKFSLDLVSGGLRITDLQLKLDQNGSIAIPKLDLAIASPFGFSGTIKAKNIGTQVLSRGLLETFGIEGLNFDIENFQGSLSGRLLEPFGYQGQLAFGLRNIKYNNEEILSETSGLIKGSATSWTIENASLRLQQLEARAKLAIEHHKTSALAKAPWHKLGIGPTDPVHITFKTLNQNQSVYRTNEISQEVNHLGSLPWIGKFFREQKFGGQIQLEADLEGPIDRLQGKIEGSLEQPYVWGIPISSFNLSGFIDGWHLHIPELRHSGSALVGRLNIDFSKQDLPFDWYFYLNQLDIRALMGKTFAEDPRNFAYLSAEWTMAGQLKNFWASQGEVVLNTVRSKMFRNLGSRTSSVELNSNDPIKLKLTAQGLTMQDKRPLKLQGEYFDLNFIIGASKLPHQLDLSMHGSVKLDILKNFSNVIETARGEIMVDGSLKGSISKPELSIHLQERRLDPFNLKEWQPLAIGLTDFGPSLSGITMDIEVKNDKIIINKFQASKGREGKISIGGRLNFGENDRDSSQISIDLKRVEFNRLSAPIVKAADLTLSGKLLLSGRTLPLTLSGDLNIDRLQSFGNFDLRKQIVASLYDIKISSKAASGILDDQKPLLNLDLAITADKSIVIKNKSIEAVLSADLRVQGNDMKPILQGQIIANQGTFNYRRNFKINQAVVSFEDAVFPPNPRLDILGETTVSPYKVSVLISGDLQTSRMQLTIDPPNRDDGSPISNLDIILLISTGKIPEQANKTAEKASFNELVSFFAVFAEEPIEKLFDLSGQTVIREVYFDSYLSEAEQRPITRVNFPIRLGDKLNAVLQVDDEANTKISLEYLIHESITVSGSLDKSSSKPASVQKTLPADSGLDLKFRFGFD